MSKARIEALSDGIFAIAMTLLVLEIKIPDLPPNVEHGRLLERLAELRAPAAGFLITFIISGVLWYLHQVLLHSIRHMTRMAIWINLIFLMFVALLPFSAGLFGHYHVRQPIVPFLYYANLTALSGLLTMHLIYARRQGMLDEERLNHLGAGAANRIYWMFFSTALGMTLSGVALVWDGIDPSVLYATPATVLVTARIIRKVGEFLKKRRMSTVTM